MTKHGRRSDDPGCLKSCYLHPPRHFIHATCLNIALLISLWLFPTFLYRRISETGPSVVLTLVDSAAAELQNLADPKISSAELNADVTSKNGSLVTQMPITAASFSTKLHEEVENGEPHVDTPAFSNIESSSENLQFENDNASSSQDVAKDAQKEEKKMELEQVMETSSVEVFPKDEEGLGEVPRMDDEATTAPELNDSAARAQLIGDESNGAIIDSLVTAGPTDPHEDIPSFSEWTQKRLEEAEKKKSVQ